MLKSEGQQLHPEIDQVDPEKFSAPTEEVQESVLLEIFSRTLFRNFCGFLIQRIPDSLKMYSFLKAFRRINLQTIPKRLYRPSRACSKSAIKSSADSIPTESRITSGPAPAVSLCSSLSCRWVVEAGWRISERESPIFDT